MRATEPHETPPNCKQCGKSCKPNGDLICKVCSRHIDNHGCLLIHLGSYNDKCGLLRPIYGKWAEDIPEKNRLTEDELNFVLTGYGFQDYNHFCSESCGFFWALDRVRESQGE
jgi:hypothetical protein